MRTSTARARRGLPLLFAAALGACAHQAAQTSSSSMAVAGSDMTRGAFIVQLGSDTLAVEQYTRTGNRFETDIVQRQPVTTIAHYVVTLGSNGRPQTLEYSVRRPDGSPVPNAPRSVRVTYGPDTVTTQIVRDTMVTTKAAVQGAFPYAPLSFAMYELWLPTLLAAHTDSAVMPLLPIGGRQANMFPVKMLGSDGARVYYGGSPQMVRIDGGGRVLSLDGTHTTSKVLVTRVPSVDLQGLAASFAAAETAGRAFGMTSPRDTARATVGNANVWVDYGRPATRGRDVWRNGVLGDTIWRTGANAATQFSTNADLQMRGITIPAGKYTLWTHAGSNGYELIFNRQTGQWGTIYDPAQDLARVPLDVNEATAPAERFTIVVEPQGSGGVLRLMWGARQLALPFTVK